MVQNSLSHRQEGGGGVGDVEKFVGPIRGAAGRGGSGDGSSRMGEEATPG